MEDAVKEYLAVLDLIQERGFRATLSVKPSLLGLDIDYGFCLENLERVVADAASHGSFVRIDMEDHTYTDRTLEMYKAMHERYGP